MGEWGMVALSLCLRRRRRRRVGHILSWLVIRCFRFTAGKLWSIGKCNGKPCTQSSRVSKATKATKTAAGANLMIKPGKAIAQQYATTIRLDPMHADDKPLCDDGHSTPLSSEPWDVPVRHPRPCRSALAHRADRGKRVRMHARI